MIEVVEPIEIAPAPKERVTPLKVSEAIRLGAMTSKQMSGRLRKHSNGVEYACAIGAAANALGIPRYSRSQYHTINGMMGSIGDANECPVVGVWASSHCGVWASSHCLSRPSSWADMIVHLNDNHGLPREWIADYLESLGY